MSTKFRAAGAVLLAIVLAVAVAACGSNSNGGSGSTGSGSTGSGSSTSSGNSGSSTTASSGSVKNGGTVQLVEGTAPQSLDPGLDYTTQGSEVNWLVYTGLVSYSHANGTAGTKLIPGVATALPVISDGGKTYTVTMRKGLKYSDGTTAKASDFVHTMERSLKIPWGGDSTFIIPYVVGASAYASGKAKTISGITADDASGKITIHLIKPYGPFDNVLAFPAFGLVPSSTPMKVEASDPPPGIGPYKVTNIRPGASFDVVQNPMWKSEAIPNIPAGHVNVDVTINSNVNANAEAVLNNTADIYDWGDDVPGSLLAQVKSQASSRFQQVNLGGSTYYFFLNAQTKPFNNQLVREAVNVGLNREALARLSGGTIVPAGYFLPPAVPGHPTGTYPYGTGTGNLAKAKALIKQSGMAGTPVTVWSEGRAPRQQWGTYYTQFLNQIGLKATQKVIADSNYFTTIGESKKLNPQTGFADWNQDFPNPVDFYGPLLDGASITPTDNENFGQTNDPKINAAIAKYGTVPTAQLSKVASGWQSIDEYVAKKAYMAVFGYRVFPKFTSTRINYGALVFHSIYGWDFSSFALNG